jgi:copper homeostasis protein
MTLEIIAFNIESCATAQHAGANRIELCDNPPEGGTTPSYGFIKAARKKLTIELYVMIRPRGGDFLYSNEEFDVMMDNISVCKQLGCDGIVTGILNKDGSIDKDRNKKIVEYAYPLGVTFHRAFDRTNNALQAMEEIIDTGFERILTSGHQSKAVEGIQLIKTLVQKSGDRIIIMPGSGVNAGNILHIAESTGATEFHSSSGKREESKMEYQNVSMQEKMDYIVANSAEVKLMVSELKKM